jgi:hypothetical protein
VLGLAIGSIGVWWMFRVRPEPGPVIDLLAIDAEWAVVVRSETSSERAFVELVSTHRGVEWQALVPRYAGRPGAVGLASARAAISVRLTRTRPEVWAMSTRDATKLGSVALDGYAVGAWNPDGESDVVTAGDGTRSYEVVDGTGGVAIVAIDLEKGRVLWHRAWEGAAIRSVTPIETAVIVTTRVAGPVRTPSGGHPGRFALDPLTGEDLAQEFSEPAVQEVVPKGFEWPADASSPLRNHRAGRYLWLIRPGRLEVLDTESLRIVASVP